MFFTVAKMVNMDVTNEYGLCEDNYKFQPERVMAAFCRFLPMIFPSVLCCATLIMYFVADCSLVIRALIVGLESHTTRHRTKAFPSLIQQSSKHICPPLLSSFDQIAFSSF